MKNNFEKIKISRNEKCQKMKEKSTERMAEMYGKDNRNRYRKNHKKR